MKHSLRLKVALILILSFSVLIFLCWIINQTFLEGYYKNDKVNIKDIINKGYSNFKLYTDVNKIQFWKQLFLIFLILLGITASLIKEFL